MGKFVLTTDGREIEVGDKLVKYEKVNTPIGEKLIIHEVLVDENIISELLKAGIVRVIDGHPEVKDNTTVPMEIDYYVEKIAKRLGWKVNKAFNYLNSVDSIMPAAALSILLREIAIELDKKYEDHIQNSPEIYVISLLDGRITKANKAHIKNYRNFAAFRSIEDARIACRIVKPFLKDLFKSGSK